MSVLFTFPGQGAQSPGMLHRLGAHPAVASTLQQASEVLGREVLELDSAPALQSTTAVQLCLLIAGVATVRELAARGYRPDLVAGLSIGAFAAAVAAGALEFPDALRLVQLRGQLMETAYPQGYGMTAILGLDAYQLEPLLEQARAQGQRCYLANINAEKQLVVAGPDAGLQQVMDWARAAGAHKCKRLAMSVPSHCPLLDEAAKQMELAFGSVELRRPQLNYLSASAARVLHDPAALADDLAHNMARVVRWHDASRLAYERGARLALEMPPGAVLTGLVRRVFSEGIAVAVAETRPDTVNTLLERELCGGAGAG